MIIVGEDASAGKPTLSYCMDYAKSHNIPPEKTFIDNGLLYGGWETTFTYMDPYLAADGSFSLPWDGVLDGESMEYVFSSGNPTGYYSAAAAIDALMAD